MALPDSEITQLALDVEQSPSTVPTRIHHLRTGANPSSATRTMSTQNQTSAEECKIYSYFGSSIQIDQYVCAF